MGDKQYLKGPRLYLRAAEPEDLDFMYAVENDAGHWDVSDFSAPYSRFALRQYLKRTQYDIYTDRQLRLMAVEQETGTTIGTVDISDFSPHHARGEVGVLIHPAYRRRGYAREAVNLLCDYAFGFLSFHQLVARIPADNIGSLRLFHACGFVPCGLLREWWCVGDVYKDVALMQRLHSSPSPE